MTQYKKRACEMTQYKAMILLNEQTELLARVCSYE